MRRTSWPRKEGQEAAGDLSPAGKYLFFGRDRDRYRVRADSVLTTHD
jgi:hypothetical protein